MTKGLDQGIVKNAYEAAQSGLATAMADQIRDLKLLESRKIFMSTGVNADVAKRVIGDLLIMDEQSNDPIHLYINSPGGEVNSGFAIYDMIKFIKSDVYIVNCGLCASIATIVNISVPKERRLSLPNSKFLIHQPLIMGQVYGQASDLEITAQQILKTREKINKLLAEECGQNIDKVTEDTTRDYWMSAQESLDYGLIGRIVETVNDI